VVKGEKLVLHQIPSGILRRGTTCVIGNGVVLDVAVLAKEIDALRAKGHAVSPKNLKISENAHLILPHHRLFDQLQEEAKGEKKVGTTGRGIGPTYVDKVARVGLRAGDLHSLNWFETKLRDVLHEKNLILEKVYSHKPLNPKEILEEYAKHQPWFAPYVCNTSLVVHEAQHRKRSILFEGAQGTSLDVDHGTYPYVTSSNTVAGAACTGAGIGPTAIDRVVGVTKAYCTRVGGGPFPTEQKNELGDELRKKGSEFGATTGRARRCGWLDAVFLRHAVRVNGITDLAVTKLDVLNGFERLKIGVAYLREGKKSDTFVSDNRILDQSEPIYEELDGWEVLPKKPKKISDLPRTARMFLRRIEELAEAPIALVSTGADRDAQIVKRPIF
jgi:adenylosuccinate synthase